MKKRKKIDWWILGPYLTLSMIGLLEVYSASSYRLLQADENTKSLLLRQLIFIFFELERDLLSSFSQTTLFTSP